MYVNVHMDILSPSFLSFSNPLGILIDGIRVVSSFALPVNTKPLDKNSLFTSKIPPFTTVGSIRGTINNYIINNKIYCHQVLPMLFRVTLTVFISLKVLTLLDWCCKLFVIEEANFSEF